MSRRLTATDASFLYMETATSPMHISSLHVLEGDVDFDEVFQHFAERIHLVPAYRRKVAFVPFNLAHPTWEDDPDFDLTRHVKHHRLPPHASMEKALDVAMALNEPMLERDRPLWKVWVISGLEDRTLLLMMTHHSMIDGVSGIELTTIIFDFDARGGNREPPSAPWQPDEFPGAAQRVNAALRDNLSAARDNPPMRLMADPERRHLLVRAGRVLRRFVTQPVVTAPFNAGIVGRKRRLRYMMESFAEIREIRRALGGTINDVVLTVVSEALARYLDACGEHTDEAYMRILCPVSVRTEDESGTLGNRVSAVFPVLPAWPMPVTQRLTAVCAEMERIKHDREAQALALLLEAGAGIWPMALAPTQLVGTAWDPTRFAVNMPPPIVPKLGRRPPNFGVNFVCTNVPGVQVPQYLAGHEVVEVIGIILLAGNVGFSMPIVSYTQQLCLSFFCVPRLLPDVEKLVDAARNAFTELLTEARKHTQQLAV
ncbi:MAG: wax ester/triacylglycerol synthase family O-acyltransferase [Gammaproteobacteria bacterium]